MQIIYFLLPHQLLSLALSSTNNQKILNLSQNQLASCNSTAEDNHHVQIQNLFTQI